MAVQKVVPGRVFGIALLLCIGFTMGAAGPALATVDQGLVICVKKGTGYSNADLEGVYHFCQLSVQDLQTPSPPAGTLIESGTTWGDATFTSATPSLAVAWDKFESDSRTMDSGTDAGTYSVDPDGAWSHNLNEGQTLAASLEGRIGASRDYILLMEGNQWSPDGQIELSLMMGIDRPADVTFLPAHMDGDYHVIFLQLTDVSEPGPTAAVVRAAMNVNEGAWTANVTYFTSDGSLVENELDSGEISLASPTGRFEWTPPGKTNSIPANCRPTGKYSPSPKVSWTPVGMSIRPSRLECGQLPKARAMILPASTANIAWAA